MPRRLALLLWISALASTLLLFACAARRPCEPSTESERVEVATAPRPEARGGSDPCDWESGGTLGSPRCPNTGDPLPDQPITNPECRDQAVGTTRWLAMDPHTPLAITAGGELLSAGQSCCAPWAREGDAYRAIDRWGQIVGSAQISGGEGYDATACFELNLRVIEGGEGIGIYASEAGAFRQPPRAEWQPTPDEIASLGSFMEAFEPMLTTPERERHSANHRPTPLAERVLFFTTEGQCDDGRSDCRDHYAVVGGQMLVILWKSDGNRWVATHLENELTNYALAPTQTYRPIAVFDMNNDGIPEVLFAWREGTDWGQNVLMRDMRLGPWNRVAESVGGSTV